MFAFCADGCAWGIWQFSCGVCKRILEFKVDGAPEEALERINRKGYAIPYQVDHRRVVEISVNFNSSMRTIGEWKIERA